MSTAPGRWWKRAEAAFKDNRSLCLARTRLRWSQPSRIPRNPGLEAAIIKATSHDEAAVDYKSVARVFTGARASLAALMWTLARRVERTKSWVVALKGLMLVHSVLLGSDDIPAVRSIGHLPFDLSDFRDRSSKTGKSWGYTAFIRAYFKFLEYRSLVLNYHYNISNRGGETEDEEEMRCIRRLQGMQDLLDLLMQIRPYGDGMDAALILEAMDFVVIEIFDVYSGICNGIAGVLVRVFGSSGKKGMGGAASRLPAVRVLRRSAEQCSQLSGYFDVCRRLGVINAGDLPRVECIPEEDIQDLEMLVMGDGGSEVEEDEGRGNRRRGGRGAIDHKQQEEKGNGYLRKVVTREWVVFEDEFEVGKGAESGNNTGNNKPFLPRDLLVI